MDDFKRDIKSENKLKYVKQAERENIETTIEEIERLMLYREFMEQGKLREILKKFIHI